jgi:hypothetical protein
MHLKAVEEHKEVPVKEESYSEGLYNRVSNAATQLLSTGAKIQDSATVTTNEITSMRSEIVGLKQELGRRVSLERISNNAIKTLTIAKHDIEVSLMELRSISTISLIVPEDIWLKVFTHCMEDEIASYLTTMTNQPLRPTILYLSHVCHHWRQITRDSPKLWRYIPAHASRYWSPMDLSLFNHMKLFSEDVDLVVNASVNTSKSTDEKIDASLFQPNRYNIHISYGIWKTLVGNIPFKNPLSVTLYGQTNRGDNDDIYPITQFGRIQRLVLIDIQNLQRRSLKSSLPDLKQLWLHTKTFLSIDLQKELVPSLEELGISHHGTSRFSMSSPPQLPNLRVLGLTPYEIELFQNSRLPVLQTAIFYAPLEVPSLDRDTCLQQVIKIFISVTEMSFCDWKWENGSWGVAVLLEKLLPHLPGLIQVKFIDCFVDGGDLIRSFSQQSPGQSNIAVTFDRCTGITRSDCERLFETEQNLVSKLSVYV